MSFPKVPVPLRWRAALWAIAIGLIAATLSLTLERVPLGAQPGGASWIARLTARVDTIAYDWLFARRGPEPVIPEVVIIEIDANAIANVGAGYPFPRRIHADLIRRLKRAGAKVVGMDIVFAGESADTEDDRRFAAALRDCGNVVLAAQFTPSRTGYADTLAGSSDYPTAALRAAALDIGPVDIPRDEDDACRRFAPLLPHMSPEDITQERDFPGFAARIAAAYRDIPADALARELRAGRFDGRAISPAPEDATRYEDGEKARICFAGYPKLSCRYVGYDQALHGLVPPETFRGKIALVGSTLAEEHDDYLTPLRRDQADEGARRPGVEVQASIIHTLLSGHYYGTYPEERRIALVGLCALLSAFLTLRLRPLRGLLALSVLLALIIGFTAIQFSRYSVMRPAQILGATGLAYLLQSLYVYVREERRAGELRRKFGRYVGRGVLEKILSEDFVPFQEEKYVVTIMFTDLQGFTTLAERMAPGRTVALLNRYLDEMAQIIFRYGGTLDKIMGDGILAYFNAPFPVENHETRAVECALEMQRVMQAWRDFSEQAGVPALKMRIGIHAGEAIVGEIGAAHVDAVSYTVIGDTVNTAARLEPLNKEYGTDILISEAVQKRLPQTVPTLFLGDVALRGREESLRVYSVPVVPPASLPALDSGGAPAVRPA